MRMYAHDNRSSTESNAPGSELPVKYWRDTFGDEYLDRRSYIFTQYVYKTIDTAVVQPATQGGARIKTNPCLSSLN